MNQHIESIPIKEGLWTEPEAPGEKPRLIADNCTHCGELFFPRKENGICTHCGKKSLEQTTLSSTGKIYAYSVVMQRPPIYYKAEVPYGLGMVELPEGIHIETLFTGCDPEKLNVGMQVELVIEKLHEDEKGRAVLAYKFRPTST